MKVTVTTTGLDSVIRKMIRAQSKEMRLQASAEGAEDARTVISDYYRAKGRNLWLNLSLPTHGAGRKVTQWWRGIADGWHVTRATMSGANIRNSTIGLAHKIEGGTIRAKRKKFLTIPIVPEAHGLTAKQYSRTISPLFAIKGCLAESADNEKGFRPVFALKKSVTQKPVVGALPPENSYATAYAEAVLDSIIGQMEAAK